MRDTPLRRFSPPQATPRRPTLPRATGVFTAPRKLVVTLLIPVLPPRPGPKLAAGLCAGGAAGGVREGFIRLPGPGPRSAARSQTRGGQRGGCGTRGSAAACGSSEEVARAAFNFSSLFYLKGSCEHTRFLRGRLWLCQPVSRASPHPFETVQDGVFTGSPRARQAMHPFPQRRPWLVHPPHAPGRPPVSPPPPPALC